MKTNYFIILITLSFLASCQGTHKKDEMMIELKKIPQTNYTKIACPFEIDMDTITIDKINVELPIKNIGKKDLTNLYIKTTCDCTALEDYPKTLKPNEQTKVKISIDIDEKGYFSKTVVVSGSFNPLVRAVRIMGYKK
ncbi:DUF1573 domain-containing protein [Flavobacterium sp.]|jgi:hypothetical protein|uniref:DUF1573 domain-containing protein n=1 Tax=Flavobacterium sp. TaxID=239 RepID=UPI003753659F